LYPNAAMPHHGIFVETRLRHLLKTGRAEVLVVAPIPWMPKVLASRLPRYAAFAQVPREERREGVKVLHPRYSLIPKVSMSAAPASLALATYWCLRRLLVQGFDFDLIDAHYFYPDGVAAALFARWLRKPLVITARGSDVNVLTRYALPRRMVCWAASRADAVITVSGALKHALLALGVAEDKLTVARNGVDLDLFHPAEDSTRRLDPAAPVLLSVGNLLENKGHHLIIQALQDLTGATLQVVGEGEKEEKLRALAQRLGVAERVQFLGALPQSRLKHHYAAADVLVLASEREGWPNVLLESMACGTPVVATRAGGTPEIVTAPESGLLASERSAAAIGDAISRLLANYPDRAATHRYAARFGWEHTSETQLRVFESVLKR
jgi:teichuronic acid biosynthesis glycosyltransferase TuaC